MQNKEPHTKNLTLKKLGELFVIWGWKAIVVLMGFTLLLTGVVLLFLPGPGLAIIAAGLALLAVEFLWARRLLRRMKKEGDKAWKAIKNNRSG